jgi:hypothetical protein
MFDRAGLNELDGAKNKSEGKREWQIYILL